MRIVQHTPTKADDAALAVMDRNDQAVAKGVVEGVAFFVALEQVGAVQRIQRVARPRQMVAQGVPTVGRKAELELRGDLGIDSSLPEIVARRLPPPGCGGVGC